MKSRDGFTIVELVVVITIIAILTAITVFSYDRVQTQTQDDQRSSKAVIISEALEKYFEKNGEYPGCEAITSDAVDVSTNTLIGIDIDTLLTPNANKDSSNNSITCDDINIDSQGDSFAYVGDNSSNCKTGQACSSYKLKYKQNGSHDIGIIKSRHHIDLVASLNAPSGLSISATMYGTNARGIAFGGSCASGASIVRQIRYAESPNSSTGSWSSWSSGSTRYVSAKEGWKYTFSQRAMCQTANASSSWSYSSNDSTSRNITTSPRTLSVSVSYTSYNATWKWPAASGCPTGTTAEYTRFSRKDSGWDSGWSAPLGSSYRQSVWSDVSEGYRYTKYFKARCHTVHSTGPWNAQASANYIRPMTAPRVATGWKFQIYSSHKSFRWSYYTPKCGPGRMSLKEDHREYMSPMIWTDPPLGRSGWTNYSGGYGTPIGLNSHITTSWYHITGGAMPYSAHFRFKIKFYCVNTDTNRTSGWSPDDDSAKSGHYYAKNYW